MTLEESQAAASIGQIELSRAYSEVLSKRGLGTGQILVTLEDTQDRRRYLNARATIWTLLDWNSIPIINENDTVATSEIRYGDNDRLAARVATMIDANLLILLSDVDGLYRQPPPEDPDETFLSEQFVESVTTVDETIEAMAGDSRSCYARGGMRTKIEAAKIATRAGTENGDHQRGRLTIPLRMLQNGARSTWFHTSHQAVPDRKKWIAGKVNANGFIVVDQGACDALHLGNSLLAVGVKEIRGDFCRGDTVAILEGNNNQEVARGLVGYDADDARKNRLA